jgi:hypothetical protein
MLLALFLVQVNCLGAFSGTETPVHYGALPKPSTPASAKLIYLMMNVVDKVQPNDDSWKDLLFRTDGETFTKLKEERLQLSFQEKQPCSFGPLCDTVNITKDKDGAGVVWYYVYIRCQTHFDPFKIDADDPQGVAERIARAIAKHDGRHVVKNEKQTP